MSLRDRLRFQVITDLGPTQREFGESRWLYAVASDAGTPPLAGWTDQLRGYLPVPTITRGATAESLQERTARMRLVLLTSRKNVLTPYDNRSKTWFCDDQQGGCDRRSNMDGTGKYLGVRWSDRQRGGSFDQCDGCMCTSKNVLTPFDNGSKTWFCDDKQSRCDRRSNMDATGKYLGVRWSDIQRGGRFDQCDGCVRADTPLARPRANTPPGRASLWCKRGAMAKQGSKVGEITMDPDSDGDVKVCWSDGTTSSYIKVSALTQPTVADQKAACEWCKMGAVGRYKGQVGFVAMVPDGDADIKLKKADGTMVQGIGCSRGYVKAVLVHPASADQIAKFIQQCTLPAGWSCGFLEGNDKVYFWRTAVQPVEIFWEWPQGP